VGGLSAHSEGARLSGIRYRVVSEGWRREGPPLRTAYLVVSHDNGDVHELASSGSVTRVRG
jgi:hypothetical protein